MPASIELDAYFERIGYERDRAATLETLREIHALHPAAIAFENLNPLLREPVRLDAASLERKIVREGRGGYCFEQNLLLMHVLQALGFQVAGLAARVVWNMAEDTIAARGHMLLRVDLEGAIYLADVGFGGQTLTGPLRLECDIAQETPHEAFRLVRFGDDYMMQSRILGQWRSLYRFDLQRQYQPDYELTSWYLSNHPHSKFVTNLVAARPAADRRYALLNNELAVHHLNGSTERRRLGTGQEMRQVLAREFRLTLPETPGLDDVLDRFARSA
jgi:N-hydroxyarylamine O-acetyltransferase